MRLKIGFFTRFEEIDADNGTCSPIHVVVFVPLMFFSWTEIDSKSELAQFLNDFCSPVYLIPREVSVSNGVCRV